MTGAPLPTGADRVVIWEHTEEREGTLRVVTRSAADNIRRQGEQVRAGERVLTAGTRISPAVLAALASVGCVSVPVAVRPRIGLIATGDELVPPAGTPTGAQIRETNNSQLGAQTRRMHCPARDYGIAEDTAEALERALRQALTECDVILFSGGVSQGDFDFVPEVLRRNGVRLEFEQVAIKPGKPTVFGQTGTQYVFGLPGNPVSTFVVFEMLVKPFLYALMGHRYLPPSVRAPLAAGLTRRKADRLEFFPVTLGADGTVVRQEYAGAAHIHAYVQAHGMASLPPGVTSLPQGAPISVVLLSE
jgi:molybdopterin molybdotransferase